MIRPITTHCRLFIMNLKFRSTAALFMLLLLGISLGPVSALGQTQEPDVMPLPQPKTPLGQGKHNALGVELFINNFGFGVGAHYARMLGPFTELTFNTGITGIRDVSEQNFQDFFTGQQIIPNKYNRVLGFPFMLGLKRRLFAQQIDDNFRFYVSGAGGPALAFIYPYFKDFDENGLRNIYAVGNFPALEPVNDFFSGWKDGSTKWGIAGDFKIGVDIGENFSKLTSIEFGYMFYYFSGGIQVMEPQRAVRFNDNGIPIETEPFFDKQKYFGTPQISLTFGGMW